MLPTIRRINGEYHHMVKKMSTMVVTNDTDSVRNTMHYIKNMMQVMIRWE
jgi:hypothetical protein